jgi:hypothetical protein
MISARFVVEGMLLLLFFLDFCVCCGCFLSFNKIVLSTTIVLWLCARQRPTRRCVPAKLRWAIIPIRFVISLSLSLSLALTHRKIVCVGGMFRITSLAAASSASARNAMVSAVVQQRSFVARAYCQRSSLDVDANHYCSKGNEDVVWCCCCCCC